MKRISTVCAALAILFTNAMCVTVTYYCTALSCNPLNSAPWSVGLIYAIPFGVGIIACSIASYIAKKKGK